MCKKENTEETLLLYTSNENATYTGNIYRVLSLPHDYVVSFPYQLKYMDKTVTGIENKNNDGINIEHDKIESCRKKLSKIDNVILFFSNAKCSHFLFPDKSTFVDIPVRSAKLVKVTWEQSSKSFMLHLSLGNFLTSEKLDSNTSKREYFVFIKKLNIAMLLNIKMLHGMKQ